ncbi:TlpA family protein disulfide reductase [Shewanella dokdonensis]|uniref:Thioredoxin domain-containing protein n=1 Tax=Shewanella dokdonensis TaxID=712036 RepID=A0ABX8DCX2_9GAMM|nr:hypothetical protein [Shewanella dokdonensis]MCL1074739.1 hypothetical protein [Shewanella dokdonensis]QVK22280.1 hypothetical protein KHX94_12750 [Shewanella dokdonensis]
MTLKPWWILCIFFILTSIKTQASELTESYIVNTFHLQGYDVKYQNMKGEYISGQDFITHLKQDYLEAEKQEKTISLKTIKDDNKHIAVVKVVFEEKQKVTNLNPGDLIPSVSGANLLGNSIVNDFSKNNFTLITTFFAECVACIQEIPAIKDFINHHPDVSVYYITFEGPAQTRDFVKKYHIKANFISKAKPWLDDIGVKTYPTIMLADNAGKLLVARTGYNMDEGLKFIDKFLSEK